MKHFFILTFTILFSTCIFLPNLSAVWDSPGKYGYADAPLESVYGYIWLTLWYDADASIAHSMHHFFVTNDENTPIRYYYDFENRLKGPTFFPTQEDDGDGWVNINDEVVVSKNFTYEMENAERGNYRFTGFTDVHIKADTDGNGSFDANYGWRVDAATKIFIEDDD